VTGNVLLPNVVRNVHRTLNVWGNASIPIYGGCDRALIQPPMPELDFHGEEGLGNFGPLSQRLGFVPSPRIPP
jgi:inosine-uridine nucleoside N-ribohydrolase